MTRSNRFLNRLFIALVGLLLIAVAAWEGNRAAELVAIPELPDPTVLALWITAAVALVVIVLSLAWAFSRGRGRTRSLVTHSDDTGTASVEARVAADFIIDDVSRVLDVVGVNATAFTVRKQVALELVVTTRPAADLRAVVDAVHLAVIELDSVLEERVPVLLHVASGVRANHAREQRVR